MSVTNNRVIRFMSVKKIIESFYIDHKRLNYLTKTKLFQLNIINFSLLLIDERGRDRLKLKHWHKSKYRAV